MTNPPDHDDALDQRVKDALGHEPGEAYFASFPERVLARIDAEAQARRAAQRPASDWARWFGSPRALAWMGSAAALVLVSGVAFVLLRERSGGPADLVGRTAWRDEPATVVPSAPAPGVEGDAQRAAEPGSDAKEDVVDALERQARPSARPEAATAPPAMTVAPPAAPRADAQELRSREVVRDPATGEMVPAPARVDRRLVERDQAAPEPSTLREKIVAMKQRAIGSMSKTEGDAATGGAATSKWSADEAAPRANSQPASPAPIAEEREAMVRRCGTVRDPQGRVLAGATIALVETGATATSGPDGAFCLDGPATATTLRVLSVGFHTRDVTLGPDAARGPVAVTLDPVETAGGARPGRRFGFADDRAALRANDSAAGAWTGEAPMARALATRAAQRMARARREATAVSWDAAAREWSPVIAAMRSSAAQLEARAQQAEARYEAWRVEPSAERAHQWREVRDAFARAAPADARLASLPWLREGAIPR